MRLFASYKKNTLADILDNIIGGSKGGRQGRAPPPGVQILSFSCSFQLKIRKIIGFWELAPPPGENPGSATEYGPIMAKNGA